MSCDDLPISRFNKNHCHAFFGENAGNYVTRIGSGFGYAEEVPKFKSKLCYSLNGFSIHAATKINTHSRDRLSKLVKYMSRGAVSNKRIEIVEEKSGQRWVKLKLKTAYSDGTTHLRFSFLEFIEKLVAITPAPRQHLVRWCGVFASASPHRRNIVLNPEAKKGFQFKEKEKEKVKEKVKEKNDSPSPIKASNWARMLSRVFGIDVLKCECGVELKPVSVILKGDEVKRYLRHMGLDPDPPKIEEASEQTSLFSGDSYKEGFFEMAPEEFPVINHD